MLSGKAKRELKQQAHHLHPVIIMGQHGLTPAVIAETEIALNAHELIKVKINGQDRDERKEITTALCEATQSELVQSIGNMAIIYRVNPDKKAKITISNKPVKKSRSTSTRKK